MRQITEDVEKVENPNIGITDELQKTQIKKVTKITYRMDKSGTGIANQLQRCEKAQA